jgi:hypothetical protein
MELVARHLKANTGLIRDYFSVIGGSAGRVIISLAYFVSLANTLSIAEFGLFATASADGFSLALVIAAFAVLALCYAGLLIVPDLAKHTANEIEAEHAGLWRVFSRTRTFSGQLWRLFRSAASTSSVAAGGGSVLSF